MLSTLCLGLILQVSGVARGAVAVAEDGRCTSCNDDDAGGGECPPVCPTCPCTHAPRPVVASPPTVVAEPIVDQSPSFTVHHSAPHASPDPQSIFHPPRH